MNGYPRSQFHHATHNFNGDGRQTIPWQTSFAPFLPPMPHSYFERPSNVGTNRDYCKHQPSKEVASAVQRYLDINDNKSDANFELLSFHCETCKKSFQDNNCLAAHLKTHVKCEFPSCSFVASRQTLKLHEIQCHKTGKMKIVLDTPEQIAKWREERRRNYPTVSNIARKEAQQQQREESGEVLTTKEFRYNKRQGWKQRGRRDYKRGRNVLYRYDPGSTHSQMVKLATTEVVDENQNQKCAMQENEHLLHVNGKNIENKEITGTLLNLGSLAADYATSSSDDDVGDTEKQKEDTKISMPSDHCSISENKRQKLSENLDKDVKRQSKQDRSRRKHTQIQDIGPKRTRPTLLEMLLAPDIRHERNVMLQCIRFIVKKNFFGIE